MSRSSRLSWLWSILVVLVAVYVGMAAHHDQDDATRYAPLPFQPPVAIVYDAESRPVAVNAVASRPFDAGPPVAEPRASEPSTEYVAEATREWRARTRDAEGYLRREAQRVKEAKIAAGAIEPWNDGRLPSTQEGDRLFSVLRKYDSYHVVVRPEDDAGYAAAVRRWLDARDEERAAVNAAIAAWRRR